MIIILFSIQRDGAAISIETTRLLLGGLELRHPHLQLQQRATHNYLSSYHMVRGFPSSIVVIALQGPPWHLEA
jgi:hypothetical protein